ncbi:hypothetical protein ACH4JS_06965 [Streptomyces sp. NPDC017638]|uniref:hypothetical protein n=1 Tax=Streptomyces sp. NPDC017638 TaxID=3365004 RepID=UPI003796C65C
MGQPARLTSFGARAFGDLVTGAGLTVPAEECARSTPDLPEAMPGPQLFPRARRPADR